MIYILIGPSGSGKTTLTETMVRFLNAVVVSRDKLREMLFGYRPENVVAYWDRTDLNYLEKTVTSVQDAIIREALEKGKDVFVDNTNLTVKIIDDFKKYGVPLKFIPVEVDFETAITRDSLRERSAGEDVIRRQFEQFEHLKKVFDFKPWTPEPVEQILSGYYPIVSKHSTFVFDLDGTLALNTSGRSPYDWKRVGEDQLNTPVAKILDAIVDVGYDVIICSGRDASCEPETRRWLNEREIHYDALYMRKAGDNRKDSVVKEELWREISKQHHIVALFDDRQQVVDHGRKLGLTVFQVAPGKF